MKKRGRPPHKPGEKKKKIVIFIKSKNYEKAKKTVARLKRIYNADEGNKKDE